jgi:hypothetical protein
MAQNLATKYSKKVAERFKIKSMTEGSFSNDYDWNDVNSINVYSVGTATMGTYTRSGDNRYGTITEVDTTLQTLTLARDRAFTKSIDRRNLDESAGAQEAGKFLARQLDEVITPEIDVYRLAALATAAGTNSHNAATAAAATTSTNAYSNFLAVQAELSNAKVPVTGRIAFMTAAYYNFLKQSNFVLASDDAYGDRKSGKLGTVDGCEIRVVPSSYMPSATDLIVTIPDAMVSPMVLADYITHKNPRGVNGWVVEGRVVYDAFVLTAKIDGISTHKTS